MVSRDHAIYINTEDTKCVSAHEMVFSAASTEIAWTPPNCGGDGFPANILPPAVRVSPLPVGCLRRLSRLAWHLILIRNSHVKIGGV